MSNQGRVSVFGWMSSLTPIVLEQLYQDQWTCQAVLRCLPPLAQNYVMRLLVVGEGGAEENVVEGWAGNNSRGSHIEALEALQALSLIEVGGGVYELNREFLKQMRFGLGLEIGAPYKAVGGSMKQEKGGPDLRVSALDETAQGAWNRVLHYMVGSALVADRPPSMAVVKLLVRVSVMAKVEGEGNRHVMTSSGFQYLLKDEYSQLWIVLLEQVRGTGSEGSDGEDDRDFGLLHFLFRLGFLELGCAYSLNELGKKESEYVAWLEELGVTIMWPEAGLWAPTRYGVSLTTPNPAAMPIATMGSGKEGGKTVIGDGTDRGGYLILESNNKVYAYTNSPLQIALLSLFVTMQFRLPHMVVGVVTRESVRAALMNGITSAQILDFLNKNAHPEMQKRRPMIPETVADQIRLWEAERERVDAAEGSLFDGFTSAKLFGAVAQYADDMGVLLYQNKQKRLLVVTPDGAGPIEEYMESMDDGGGGLLM